MIQSRRGLILTAFAAPNAFGDDGACPGHGTNYGTDNFCRSSMSKRAPPSLHAPMFPARRVVPGESVTELAEGAVNSSG